MNLQLLIYGYHLYQAFVCIFALFIDETQTTPSKYIVNPHPFTYILNNELLCQERNADLLIWVHSATYNFKKRLLIRETWGNPLSFRTHNAGLVFFLGMTKNTTLQGMVEYENEVYGDIVQETYLDSYKNLTYKAIQGAKWTSDFCKSAKLILKTDDDVVVDIYLLLKHIQSLQETNRVLNNTILCHVIYNGKVDRGPSKWSTTKKEYPKDKYPPYCPGLAIVMTGDIIPKLYNASLYEPFFWVDDVYLTGMLAETINVTFEQYVSTVPVGSPQQIKEQTIFQSEYQWLFYRIDNINMFTVLWKMITSRENSRLH